MLLTKELKEEIDKMTIYQLLEKNRFCSVGDSLFQGDSGIYFLSRLKQIRDQDNAAYVGASKLLGWG